MEKRREVKVVLETDSDGRAVRIGNQEEWQEKTHPRADEENEEYEAQEVVAEFERLGRTTDKTWRRHLSIKVGILRFLEKPIPPELYVLWEKFGKRDSNLSRSNKKSADEANRKAEQYRALAAEIVARNPTLKNNASRLAHHIAEEHGGNKRTIRRLLKR